ncbi:phosphoribosylformylglycinamidine synthase [Candidatus Daviesbacteria bacterium]|nr:phosphoribosylformylglycinamidine synthase [Candidatus Daviesbacteria bacterium]
MVARIEVFAKVEDTRAKVKKKKLESSDFPGKIQELFLVDVFTIDKSFSLSQFEKIARMLINPVSQEFVVSTEKDKKYLNLKKFDFAIEIGFLPGVTDNIAHTVKEEIEDSFKEKFAQGENVYSSQIIFISGNLTQKNSENLVKNLINSLIQRAEIKSYSQYIKDRGMDFIVPKVKLTGKAEVIEVDLDISDEQLTLIGKQGIKNKDNTRRGPLALDLVYLKEIQKYFKKLNRNPTDIELETLAQTWSEHCKHTIFADPIDEIKNGLFKTYIKGATEKIRKKKGKKDFCVSVFSDNSGAIEFDNKYLITHKVETHNSPSALDPFGGALTGIVGVNRDTIGFGLGSKPVLNTYGFCFADPNNSTRYFRDKDLTQEVLSAKKIMEGVIEGVNVGGNCSGIPTPQGFLFFDDRYRAKPLVFCGTVGLIPKKAGAKLSHIKKAKPGDYIVMIGGRVGLDGIHGATFSSEEISSGSPATAVQIGDPITQKKFSDAIVKDSRDLNLFNSITDNGAGGLSSSVGEMAKESGGCKVFLEKVPVKYPGMQPWQIWISESQERMTLAVAKNKWKKFSKLMESRGVEATIIGEFTNSAKCQVFYKQSLPSGEGKNKLILDLEMEFLHNGLPKIHRKTKKPKLDINSRLSVEREYFSAKEALLKMLSRLNITSFEFISQQYDHEVQGESVLKPLQGKGRVNGEATISRVVLDSDQGVVLSQGLYPSYSEIDSYHMAASSIDSAIRNAVCVGANLEKLALLDNFCWCSSDDPERLYQLKMAAKACYDYAVAFRTPFISGKDSMFNDFKGFDERGESVKISVPPTLLISSIGIIDDIKKAVSLDLKFPGDLIYILGETFDELAGSELYFMLNQSGGNIPKVNAKVNLKLYQSLQKAIEQELVASAQSVNRGGLIIALAKTALAGKLGLEIDLKKLPGVVKKDDIALFSESQGRIVVSVSPENSKKFEKIMNGNNFNLIGEVRGDNQFKVMGISGKAIIETDLEILEKAYKKTFNDY